MQGSWPWAAYAIKPAGPWWLPRRLLCRKRCHSQSVGLRPRRSSHSAVRLATSRPAPQGGLRWSCPWGRPGRSSPPLRCGRPISCHPAGPAAPLEPSARRLRRSRLSNPTFNRSSNGWPPCPRGSLLSILRLAGKASTRRRPVNSALGLRNQSCQVDRTLFEWLTASR